MRIKKLLSLLLCVTFLIGIIPVTTLAADEEKYTLTLSGFKKPVSGEAPSYDISIENAGFTAFGYSWTDRDEIFINASNTDMANFMPVLMEKSSMYEFTTFADAETYLFEGILLYNGSESFTVGEEMKIVVKDNNGNEVGKFEGGYIPSSYLSSACPAGITIPEALKNAKGMVTISSNRMIASTADHEHDDDNYQYDDNYHWSCCSTCGVQIGERREHYYQSDGSFTTWKKEAATATAEGRYYMTCSGCNKVLKEYTIPKTGDQTVVTSYTELAEAIKKGGKQYIKCDFKASGVYIYNDNVYYSKDAEDTVLTLNDPDAEVFVDMNGYKISYETIHAGSMIDVKAGKLVLFNEKSYNISQEYSKAFNMWISSNNVQQSVLVEENGELDLVNMAFMNMGGSEWHGSPDVVSYGKLSVYGGFFQSTRRDGWKIDDTMGAILVYGGETTIYAAFVLGAENAVYVGERSYDFDKYPLLTINDANISATYGIYQGRNGNLIINDCETIDSDWLSTKTVIGLTKAKNSGTLIINDCSLRGHENALFIQDTESKTVINGGAFFLKEGVRYVDQNQDGAVGAISVIPNATNVTITEAQIDGKPCIDSRYGTFTPSDYISSASTVRVDYATYNNLDQAVYSLGAERVVISACHISGTVNYTSGVCYNTATSIGFTGNIAKVNSSARNLQWQYYDNNQWNNISGATTGTYTFKDASLIGKQVRVVATADGFSGTITSTPVTLEKQSNTYKSIDNPTLTVVTTTSLRINNYRSNMEYIVSDSKTSASSLTESDWANAKTQQTFTGLTEDKTYYVYARYKETATTTVGKIIASSSVVMKTTAYCQNVVLGNYANYGTIYIEKGKKVTLPVTYTPVNANAGQQYQFEASSTTGISLMGVGVSAKVAIGKTGNLVITGNTVGNYTLKAYYMTYTENQYGVWNVVVFDPENVAMYQMKPTSAFGDAIIPVGGTYKVATPTYYPCPADTSKYKTVCYFEKGTATGSIRYYENDYITINKDTGLISAKKATTSPITVYVGLTDGTSINKVGSFSLTVTSKSIVYLEDFALNYSSLTLDKGEIAQLTTTLTPSNATVTATKYLSSNEGVAAVSSSGIITAVNEGTATITATIGAISKTCTVYVGTKNISYTVSGNITSFGEDTQEVTVALYKEGEDTAAYSAKVTGNSASYSISDVAPGTYTMKVSKTKHATREYTVTVGSFDVTLDVKILLYGDVDGSGEIDNKDATQVKRYFNTLSNVIESATDEADKTYLIKVADVNSDGEVDNKDATQIKRFFNSLTSVFDSLS